MLYASSAALIAIGPLCGLGSWYEEQSIGSVSGSMIIRAVGAAAYFIGRALSSEPAGFWVSWLDIVGVASLLTALLVGGIIGYGIRHLTLFLLLYLVVGAVSWILPKRMPNI